ncbi:MAG: hypothetical protein ABR568_17675, partial [Pyrinomonadaceae bacterium]
MTRKQPNRNQQHTKEQHESTNRWRLTSSGSILCFCLHVDVADLIGLYAMVGAGYDPQAQASLWDRYHELKGKTGGGFLSNLFGRTKPEQKRLREMLKGLEFLPAACRGVRNIASGEEFRQWQTAVVSYTSNLGRKESVPGLISKQVLQPALRSDINLLRFSPDGKFILAQDDSGINVLSHEPLAPLFRIDAMEAKPAQFTPDSSMIVFSTSNMRVEVWDVAEKKIKTAYELVTRKKCLQTALAPDGNWENVVMEVRDGRTLSPLWTLAFPNERPRYWAAPREGTLTLLWPVSSKAVAAETKDQPDLKAQLTALKEKKGDYLLKVLDLKDGKALGKLLIETGKGSFRITDVLTSDDWVAISDTQNRTLVYS